MHGSLYFYEVLLNNTDDLLIPEEVAQALRCILVTPASNADPERSFSTANRLYSEEKSNINTDTLDYDDVLEDNWLDMDNINIAQTTNRYEHWTSRKTMIF
ncbi:hypothetical protein Y032_0715g1774 [Ancylostoma ceylanicum]|uniref:HAT C-terminal dimerisation domain-containing protein n=1 Tax=Ancylostoma ceylanicum TaxID=53326 RepID=A0A016WFQ1_9BILA|nr:hypothetical protein Y032_0715g1774 [Ancylostoma ceylanicum]